MSELEEEITNRYPEMDETEVQEAINEALRMLKRREVNVWRRIFVGIGIIREAIMETGAPVPIVQAVVGVLESMHPRETSIVVREMQNRVFGMRRKG